MDHKEQFAPPQEKIDCLFTENGFAESNNGFSFKNHNLFAQESLSQMFPHQIELHSRRQNFMVMKRKVDSSKLEEFSQHQNEDDEPKNLKNQQIQQQIEHFSFADLSKHQFSLQGESNSKQHKKNEHRESSEVSFGENNEKGWKGLRNLSFRVKKIIQKDEQTSYKEVADKLVREMRSDNKRKTNNTQLVKEEQNVKRRVYDALNVLLAIDVIIKIGKGLCATSKTFLTGRCLNRNSWSEVKDQEDRLLELRKQNRLKKIYLNELQQRYLSLCGLIERNKQLENGKSFPSSQSAEGFIKKEEEIVPPFQFSQQSVQSIKQITLIDQNTFFPIIAFFAPDVQFSMGKEQKTLRISTKQPLDIMLDMDILVKLDFGRDVNISKALGKQFTEFAQKKRNK